jgi:ABC-type branched-subunit amino acid transport system permease subunit
VIAPLLGRFEFDMFGKVGFIYSLSVLFVLFLLARRIVHSPFGLSLRAIKNNPLRAAAIGIPVDRRLIVIYTIAAFYAGIAGGLLAQTTSFASLDVFSFDRSADLLLVLIIGGVGYLYVQGDAGLPVGSNAAVLAVLDRRAARRHGADRARPYHCVERAAARSGLQT